jgi:hypothetical protein
MRFAIAAGLLAQTLPTILADEANNKVRNLTRVARKKRFHGLIHKLSGDFQKKDQESIVDTPTFLEKRFPRGGGILRNPAVVECDPTSENKADVGILGCGMNQYCAESEDSNLGGFCLNSDADMDPKNRDLGHYGDYLLLDYFIPLLKGYCDPASYYFGYENINCDCDGFNLEDSVGTITCTSDYYCYSDGVCGTYSFSGVISTDPDVQSFEYCLQITAPIETSFCLGIDSMPACSISVDNVACQSCDVQERFYDGYYYGNNDDYYKHYFGDGDYNNDGSYYNTCREFDCTNTAVGIKGNTCDGDYIYDALFPSNDSTLSPSNDSPLSPSNDKNYTRIVSLNFEEDWCLTASQGTDDEEKLGFEICQFGDVSADQLWYIDEQGLFRSGLDFDKCMVPGFGEAFADVTARINDCDEPFRFQYSGDQTIRPLEGEANQLCLTNDGINANDGDTMHFKTCTDEKRFKWELSSTNIPVSPVIPGPTPGPPLPDEQYFNLALSNQDDLCIGLDRSSARIGSTLKLVDCDTSSLRQQFGFYDGMIYLGIVGDALTKCLQAGLGEPAEDGEWIRIKYCDPDDEQQKFTFNWPDSSGGSISLATNPDLCVANQGVTINHGDRMVVKKCDSLTTERAEYKVIV